VCVVAMLWGDFVVVRAFAVGGWRAGEGECIEKKMQNKMTEETRRETFRVLRRRSNMYLFCKMKVGYSNQMRCTACNCDPLAFGFFSAPR
jgi:hypothetical protein